MFAATALECGPSLYLVYFDLGKKRHHKIKWLIEFPPSPIGNSVLVAPGEFNDRILEMQLSKPWQSFRAAFRADRHWKTLRVPFSNFVPHRHDIRFDPAHLRRIGVLAIGRELQADVEVAASRLFRSPNLI